MAIQARERFPEFPERFATYIRQEMEERYPEGEWNVIIVEGGDGWGYDIWCDLL